jgi:pimeloyl-ACP methyl ester carboxylesterase
MGGAPGALDAARRTGYLVVDGKRLETAYLPGYGEAAPVIVLLHEGLGSIALWKDFPERVREATGCAIFAYSRYGYGGSEPLVEKRPLTYMHREGEVVLPALLRAAGIERPVLLGHSDGASIALLYAGFAPEGVRALIVLAPHLFVEDVSVRSIAQAKVAYETTDLRARLARYHDDPDSAFRGWNDAWLDPEFRTWNIEASLARIDCPVLAIQGEDDEYGTRAQIDAVATHVPGARTVMLPGCGHSPQRDRPAETLTAIAAFLTGAGIIDDAQTQTGTGRVSSASKSSATRA